MAVFGCGRAAQGGDDIDTLDDFATALLVDWLEQARPGRQIAEGDRTARARALPATILRTC